MTKHHLMDVEMLLMVLSWLAVGGLSGWFAAPLMRLRGRLAALSICVGMAGALAGGVLITLLKAAIRSEAADVDPGSLLFVLAFSVVGLTMMPLFVATQDTRRTNS